ncbi:MAG: hypothetical protein ABSF91_05105 [Bacteroidota bacterium]|jgi:hypothetical protein
MSKTPTNDFMQRWGIVIPKEKLFSEFRNRVSTAVGSFLSDLKYLDEMIYDIEATSLVAAVEGKFAVINGSEYVDPAYLAIGQGIIKHLTNAQGLSELILVLQRLFWSLEQLSASYETLDEFKTAVQSLIANLNTAIESSSGINIRRIENIDGKMELYPDGIKLLDEAVDENAIWLRKYPDVVKEYNKALSIAVSKDASMYRQALDSLRFALENLLKVVLGNNSPIEKQKEPLLKWMKEKGVHSQIRQNYFTMLTQFSLYQSTAVKHDSDFEPADERVYSDSELEYMIYLTTTLMRFLIETYRATETK